MRFPKTTIVVLVIFIPLLAGSRSAMSASCADLKTTPFGLEVTITSATVADATPTEPEHCDVRGMILPEIRFAVKLPTQWNSRLYMVGNHGKAGEIDHEAMKRGLRRGCATAGTDTGHDVKKEPGAMFAYKNRQKEIDFGYRAVHETAAAAKEIIKAYYGRYPAFSYFIGSSTGGRQALMEAQRYPLDFNGILSGNPFPDYLCHHMSAAWELQALMAPDSVGIDPVPVKNKILSIDKLPLLSKAVYAKCDGIDGLVDGMIDDPRRCNFDPEKDLPLCSGDIDARDCFTAAQVKALKKVYGGVISRGELICATVTLGGEAGWGSFLLAPGTERPRGYTMIWDSFKYLLFEKDDPNYEFLKDFNFDRDPPKLNFMKRFYLTDDAELIPFQKNGGKMMIEHGWGDSTHMPLATVWYYEKILDSMGAEAKDFCRLFMIPGLFGLSVEMELPGTGPGPSSFDMFGPLVNWVEKGIAPERITASHFTAGKVDRTRPLCPYPKVARYTGNGSTDDEANFICVELPK